MDAFWVERTHSPSSHGSSHTWTAWGQAMSRAAMEINRAPNQTQVRSRCIAWFPQKSNPQVNQIVTPIIILPASFKLINRTSLLKNNNSDHAMST
jgi:hypothetical protein